MAPLSVFVVLELTIVFGTESPLDQFVKRTCVALPAQPCDHSLPGMMAINVTSLGKATVPSVDACAAKCLMNQACISFNFLPPAQAEGINCEFNGFGMRYTVVQTASQSVHYLRVTPRNETLAIQKVPYIASFPRGNVSLSVGSVFHSAMARSADYLLRIYDIDNMLWWFRQRAMCPSGINNNCTGGHGPVASEKLVVDCFRRSGINVNNCNSNKRFDLYMYDQASKQWGNVHANINCAGGGGGYPTPGPEPYSIGIPFTECEASCSSDGLCEGIIVSKPYAALVWPILGKPRGWDSCVNNLRGGGDAYCAKGTAASTFLMGAGGLLRWPDASGKIDRTSLANRLDALLTGMEISRDNVTGLVAGYAANEVMNRENPSYVTSWLIYGLLEAALLPQHESIALGMVRSQLDWFNHRQYNWLLPEFLPADTEWTDLLPAFGSEVGHEIYLIYQGMVHNTQTALSKVGRQLDVEVVRELYNDDQWMKQLIEKDELGIWQKHWYPHNYEVTGFEGYLDMYTLTGNQTYLQAAIGAWEMFTESFIHVGGAIAINEGSTGNYSGPDSPGLWYPPKSYYLEGDPISTFQKTAKHTNGETCGSVFWVKLNQRFHLLYPEEEKYVAEIERTMINIGLANQHQWPIGDPHPSGVRSMNLLHGHKTPLSNVTTCCEGQGTRLHATMPEYIFSFGKHSTTDLFINIPAASSIDFAVSGQSVRVEIQSSFPYTSDNVTVTVSTPGLDAPLPLEIAIRIPAWVASETVAIFLGGQHLQNEIARGTPGRYVHVHRDWNTGDKITMAMPMKLQVHEYTGYSQIPGFQRVAYTYGPTLMAAVPSSGWNTTDDCLHIDGVDATQPDTFLSRVGDPTRTLKFSVHGAANVQYKPYFEVDDEQFTAYPAFQRLTQVVVI